MGYRLTRTAEDQIDTILLVSAKKHRLEAASRYNLLMIAAMEAVAEDPKRPGSRYIPKVSGVRVCSIAVGRFKIDRSLRVQTPRHLVVYRVATDGVVEIVGMIHDRMLLPRAARRAIRDADKA